MCGIAGYFGAREISDEAMSSATKAMHNRGPDHQGFIKRAVGDSGAGQMQLGYFCPGLRSSISIRARICRLFAGRWLLFAMERSTITRLCAAS